VNLRARVRWGTVVVLGCASFLCTSLVCASDKDKDKDKKDKPKGAQQVDAGSFGVFVRGQRVVTETFSVQQENGISVVKSRLKETGSGASAGQS
jgi:hypothetical protein